MAKVIIEIDDAELDELVRKNYVEANYNYLMQQAKNACVRCANNPSNGGSGVCNCMLGMSMISHAELHNSL